MKPFVRRAYNNDGKSIRRVLHLAHRRNLRLGFPFPAAFVTNAQLRFLMHRDRYYVLCLGREIVGTVAIKRRNGCWEISSLAVLPWHRKKRYGNRLLKFAEGVVKRLGGKKAILFTPLSHPTLPRYYRKHGYRTSSIVRLRGRCWIRFSKRFTYSR